MIHSCPIPTLRVHAVGVCVESAEPAAAPRAEMPDYALAPALVPRLRGWAVGMGVSQIGISQWALAESSSWKSCGAGRAMLIRVI